jgi:GNAT superfamily N-acetyltransferase
MGFFFGEDYREDATLADRSAVRLRLLRSSDKRKIAAGFRRLSPESRYRRFFRQLDDLPERMLDYLTSPDGVDHVALVAARLDSRGREKDIVGEARFIRSEKEPEVAEAAVAVIDSMQRKRLGTLLCGRLIGAAAERGVKRFRSYLLSENTPMREMILKAFPDLQFERDGHVLIAELELPEAPEHPLRIEEPQAVLVFELLRLAGRGAVLVRTALDRLFPAKRT